MSEQKKIGPDEVAHMATLSRLRVSPEEQQIFAKQFGDILGYMDTLQKVDVENTEPLYSPVTHHFVPREDVAINTRSHEDVLKNSPESDESYFVVPRIV